MNSGPFDPVKSYEIVNFYCPNCTKSYDVRPPFNLVEFRCPGCVMVSYPLVYVDKVLVDLRMMREILCAIYGSPGSDQRVMQYYFRKSHIVRTHEPLVDGRLLVFHAARSCYHRAVVKKRSFRELLMLIVPPMYFLERWRSGCKASNLYVSYIDTCLGATSFDPRFEPLIFSGENASGAVEWVNAAVSKADVGVWGEPMYLLVSANGLGGVLGERVGHFTLAVDARSQKLSADAVRRGLYEKIVGGVSEAGGRFRERHVATECHRVDGSYVCQEQVDAIRALSVQSLKGNQEEVCGMQGEQVAVVCEGEFSSRFEWYDVLTGDGVACLLEIYRYSNRVVFNCTTYRRFAYSRGSQGASGAVADRGKVFVPEGRAMEILIAREEREEFLDYLGLMVVMLVGAAAGVCLLFANTLGAALLVGLVKSIFYMCIFGIILAFLAVLFDPSELQGLPAEYRNPPDWPSDSYLAQERKREFREHLEDVYRLKHSIADGSIYMMFHPVNITENRVYRVSALSEACVRTLQDAIIDCCEDAGLDMSEYRRQLMQIHNHGVMVNEVKGDVVASALGVEENTQSKSVVGRVFGSSGSTGKGASSGFSGGGGGE